MRKLKIAVCQFPVTRNLVANGDWMLRQMKEARRRGARLVQFSETGLSGYAAIDPPITKESDWRVLRGQTERIMKAAADLRLWVVLGSTHRLTGDHKPHNSLYVIDDRGRLLTRYDKAFCCGRGGARPTADLKHYSPGSDLISFEVRGIRIGLLICHDFRYPELYREYKRRGVDLVLHSYHQARMTAKALKYYQDHVQFTMQTAAACNFLWISVNNSCERHAWPSFVVNPAGAVVGKLRSHAPGVLVHEIDTGFVGYDPSVYWRHQCMSGILHSGKLVRDPRSRARAKL